MPDPISQPVKITTEGDQTIWQDFEQPHRAEKWDYKTFGPFRFETKAYQQALKAAGLTDRKA